MKKKSQKQKVEHIPRDVMDMKLRSNPFTPDQYYPEEEEEEQVFIAKATGRYG